VFFISIQLLSNLNNLWAVSVFHTQNKLLLGISGRTGKTASFHDQDAGPLPDKKFEGYSNLKGQSVKADKKAKKASMGGEKAGMETEYIEVLQK